MLIKITFLILLSLDNNIYYCAYLRITSCLSCSDVFSPFATLIPVVILVKSIELQVFFKNHLYLKQSHKNHLLMLPYFSLLFISCNKLITSLSPKKTIPLIAVIVSGIIKLANENSFLPYTS